MVFLVEKETAGDVGLETKEAGGEIVLTLGSLPLFVEGMEATKVPKPGGKDGEAVAAYEITLKAVLPEHLIAPLAAAIRNHRIVVRLEPAR